MASDSKINKLSRLLATRIKKLPSMVDSFWLRKKRPNHDRPSKSGAEVDQILHFESFEPRLLLSADLIPIQGSLEVPGESDAYSFTLTEKKTIYFDSQTNNNQFRWSLDGPDGALVTDRLFTASDSYERPDPVALELQPGEYVLSVDGIAAATGEYQFRLLDLANAASLTLDNRVDEAFENPTETDLYQFNAQAGDRIFVDREELSGNLPYMRLLDPDNQQVFSRVGFDDYGIVSLDKTGTYTFMMEGRVTDGSPADYAFTLYSVTDDETAMSLDDLVAGRISVPGQQDRYTFTLGADTRLYFDAVHPARYDVKWSLVGPNGTIVSNRNFYDSDSYWANPALDLMAGDYVLTVDADAALTSDYAFRLLSGAGAQSIALNEVVSGQLDDAGLLHLQSRTETAAPIVPLNAGDQNRAFDTLGLAYYAVADNAALRPEAITVEAWMRPSAIRTWDSVLMKASTSSWNDGYGLFTNSDGTVGFYVNSYSGNSVRTTIPVNEWTHMAGVYDGATMSLYVNGVLVASHDYSAAINHSTAPLLLGRGSGGAYQWQGQIDDVRLWDTARTAEQIAASFDQTLQGDEEGLAAYWRFNESLGETAIDATANGLDATLSNIPSRATKMYTFSAVAGQRVYFDSQVSSGNGFAYSLYRPDGVRLFGETGFADRDVFTLSQSGDYQLLLEGRVDASIGSSYAFTLVEVVDDTEAMALDTTINGAIDHKGQRDIYTFSVASDTRAVFDTLTYRGDIKWTLQGPQGTLVSSRTLYSSDADWISGDPSLDLIAGDYTLTFDADGEATGDYAFRLLNFATATAVVYDVGQVDTMSPGSESRLYTFAGTAGDTLNFNWDQALPNDDARWRLYGPYGELIFGPESASSLDKNGIVLRLDGDYTLAIEGPPYNADDRPLGFTIEFVENVTVAPLQGLVYTLGDQQDGAVSVIGEVDQYIFTISQPTLVAMDMLSTTSNLVAWTLTGPTGTLVSERRAQSTDGLNLSSNSVIELRAPGTYQVTLSGYASSYTGDYHWRLLDLAANASAYTPGDVLSSTLTPGNATEIFKFNADADDRIYVDVQSGYGNLAWRLIDGFGRQFRYQYGLADQGPLTLDVGGDWYLLVEGYFYDTAATRDYTLNVVPVPDEVATEIDPTEDVSASIAYPGERDLYTFDLDTRKRIYFDSFSRDSSISWTLSGPTGTLVSNRTFYSSDGENFASNPVLNLDAGSYTLIVDGTTDRVADYRFALLDLDEVAQAITPGVDVVSQLDPAASTSVYKFDANAGQRFYFDQLGANANARSFRIIDKFGQQSYFYGNLQDNGPFALPFDGEYLLLIEGRSDESGTVAADITFNLQTVVDHAPVAIALNETVDAQILVPGETRSYSLALDRDGLYYLDSFTSNTNERWSLSGPNGTVVSNRDLYYSDSDRIGATSPVFSLGAGDYVITVDGINATVSPYSFRFINIADQARAIQVDTAVVGVLEPSSATQVFSFTGDADDLFYFDLQAFSNTTGNFALRLYDHVGRQIFYRGDVNDYGRFTTSLGGTYYLMIEGRSDDASASTSYQFELHSVVNESVTLNSLQDTGLPLGPLSAPGVNGQDALWLSGQEYIEVADGPATDLTGDVTMEAWVRPDRLIGSWMPLFFKGDSVSSHNRGYSLWLNNSGYLHLSTSDGSNQTISTPSGLIPSDTWSHVAAVIDRTNGTMSVYVNGELSASASVRTNAAVSTDAPLRIGYAFENSTSYNAFEGAIQDVRLWSVARTAEQIADNHAVALQGDEAGLSVWLPLNDATGSTSVQDAVPNAVSAQIYNRLAGYTDAIVGRIDMPGQVDRYQFSLTQDTQLVFDTFSDNSRIEIRLSNDKGLTITRNLRAADTEIGGTNPVIQADAGNYTLEVYALGSETDAYAFRLLDFADANVITDFGTPISSTLSPFNQTELYQFDAAAGDAFFFDVQALGTSSSYVYWRLIDPFGQQNFSATTFTDEDLRTLAFDGTYTLIVEGRVHYDDREVVPYQFSVNKVAVEDAPLPLGTGNPNAGPWWSDGRFGGGLEFTGVDHLEVANSTSVNQNQQLTMEAWVKVDRYADTWTAGVLQGAG